MKAKTTAIAAAIAACGLFGAAHADSVTSNFDVTATIENQCIIDAVPAFGFDEQGLVAADVTMTSDIKIRCTGGSVYTMRLDAGKNGTGNSRRMKRGILPVYLNYNLYSDASYSTPWDNNTGVTDTGSGQPANAKTFTVYAKLPAQNTPMTGTFTDTVKLSVSF